MMIYEYLLYFLGLSCWSYKSSNCVEKLFQKRILDLKPSMPIKNAKKILKLDELDSGTSPSNLNLHIISLKFLTFNQKVKLYFYNLYSLLIFCYLSIQPFYLFYKTVTDHNNFVDYFCTFLINLNTPINYIWAKYYFRYNHFDLFTDSCKYNCFSYIFLIIILSTISIIINLFTIDTFYNEFYFIYRFSQPIGIILVLIEWIYARLLYGLSISCFTIVFCKHVKEIRNLIRTLKQNELDLEDSYCLTSLINKVTELRLAVEKSIKLFNKIISFITVTGGLSIVIFMRHIYKRTHSNTSNEITEIAYSNDSNDSNDSNEIVDSTQIIDNFQIKNNEFFLIQSYSLYILCQLIYFYNVIYYFELRNKLVKQIGSSSFVNRFLTRWSVSKLKRKCKDNDEIKQMNKMMLCIQQENATSIDWIILEKLITYKWMDFSILGISTQDGNLIKKVITFGGIIYIIFSYLN